MTISGVNVIIEAVEFDEMVARIVQLEADLRQMKESIYWALGERVWTHAHWSVGLSMAIIWATCELAAIWIKSVETRLRRE